jgi:hypothetical protein
MSTMREAQLGDPRVFGGREQAHRDVVLRDQPRELISLLTDIQGDSPSP